MDFNFKYDLSSLTDFVDQACFRREIELWRFEGHTSVTDVVFDDNGVMVLVVPVFGNSGKSLSIKVCEQGPL